MLKILSMCVACFLWSHFASAVRFQQQCPVAVEEDSASHDVICEDIASSDRVEWSANINIGTLSGSCTSPPYSCTNGFPSYGEGSRSGSGSQLTVTIKSVSRTTWGATTVTCRTTSSSSSGTTGTASCDVDVIYAARAADTMCTLTTSTRWTMVGSCSISKVFSSRDSYSCQLRQGSATGPSVASTDYTPTMSGTPSYGSGSCDYTAPLPTTSGTWSYVVIVQPGATVVTVSDTITVARPTSDPQISCRGPQDQYVHENSDLDCYCHASDLGQPEGRLRVYLDGALTMDGSYGNGNVTFRKQGVSRSDDGAVYRCVLDWATGDTDDRATTFTVRVAYGPDSASISDPGVFDLHPTTPGTMTLTCTAAASAPGVTYSWTRVCSSSTDRTCSFTPTISSNGDVISCTVTNNVTGVSASASRTLTIHYPPTDLPTIAGYNGPLYDGETSNINCTVQGGNPPVTSVTFGCGGQGQTSSEVSKVISVRASPDKNGETCTCSANWENKSPAWYTHTASLNLTVYYAPSQPHISYRDQSFPFMADTSATLYCSFQSGANRGNPEATLNWQEGGGTTGQGEVNLTFPYLRASDHRRSVVCEASNLFTDRTSPAITSFQLQVYYPPAITVTPLQTDACVMTSPNTCVVGKGQRVHMECSASQSHPSLAWVSWQHTSTRTLDFVADADSSRAYVCEASTVTLGSDGRLPLTALFDLNVIVSDAAVVTSFTADGVSDQVTVNGSTTQHVVLSCTAVGRPAPGLALLKGSSEQLVTKQGGDLTMQRSSVTYELPAHCDNTAVYRCEADNGLGTPSQASVVLNVLCPPRLTTTQSPSNLPVVTFQGTAAYLTFDLLTFPVPDIFSVLYLGQESSSSGTERPVRHDLFKITCVQEGMTPSATCVIRVQGVTSDDEGVYRADVRNSEGQTSFLFRVATREGGSECDCGSDLVLIIVLIVVGALLALCVLVIILFLVWTWRRGWTLPCTAADSGKCVNDAADRNPTKDSPDYLQPVPPSVQDTAPAGPYDSLEMSDVGLRSPYDEIGHHATRH